MFELRSGDAVAEVVPEAGGRIRQLTVAGLDLLMAQGKGLFDWGLFPMVPFAGRIRHGRFAFRGVDHQLPIGAPPHAIHGTLLDVVWNGDALDGCSAHLWTTLDHPWPWKGDVRHDLGLEPDRLVLRLSLRAAHTMPVTIGWHPWWRRRLAVGEPAHLDFTAASMYERDDAGIPTGQLVPPSPGPWDDCFTDLQGWPSLTWPGALRVTMEHTCDHLVVYDEPDDALCVEPQTGPPDAANLGWAGIVEAGATATARLEVRWEVP